MIENFTWFFDSSEKVSLRRVIRNHL